MQSTILPLELGPLRIIEVSVAGDAASVEAAPRQRTATCPDCRGRARRVHSHYRRTVRDLPCSGIAVILHLRVRRFVCRNRRCPRRIFCERLPGLVKRHGRLSFRLERALQHVGMALGGEAGSRLAARLAMPVSPAGLLQFVRRVPAANGQAGAVLGVDDWARRKGRSYGTILVDLEAHRPVDLLEDRSVAELATWLEQHPGVRVVSRDRGKEYAEGARRGAPNAVQVADRWHLLKNLGDALERLFTRKSGWLGSPARATTDGKGGRSLAGTPPTPPTTAAERDRAARRRQRIERYAEVRALEEQGHSLSAIARQVGLARNTVVRYARAETFPERAPRRPGPASPGRFEAELQRSWSDGERSARQFWRRLRERGYPGSVVTVRRAIARWKAEGSWPVDPAPTQAQPSVRRLSPREAAWLMTRFSDELGPRDGESLHRLLATDPAVDATYGLAQEFRRLVRERDADGLGSWLDRARESGVQELRGFADHLQRDRAAVDAALTSPWSNGQTEGQITRLKLLKRQMYGRANLDLLRLRVLYRG
jgi:transposase